VGELFTEFLLMVFCLIFLLSQGNKIWTFLLGAVPRRVRHRVDLAGRSGFTTLARYVLGTAAVAVVDAVGIGVGLVVLGVPLAAPLSTLVFFGAFIPVVGSVVAGAVAVLVALVTNGAVSAIIVLAIVVGVMQLESHVLQPSCSVALCACTRWPSCSPWPPGSSRPASWVLCSPCRCSPSSAQPRHTTTACHPQPTRPRDLTGTDRAHAADRLRPGDHAGT
jgi:hypothetical protein